MKGKGKKEPTWDEIGKTIKTKVGKECDECAPKKGLMGGCQPSAGCGGAIYGLGFLGSLIYFVTTAPDFWAAVIGVLKAIVWPAFIAFGLLKFLGM
ncbi:MAG: hypothetical protein WCW13_02225 [archaeon]|jgi:hypothetical protein